MLSRVDLPQPDGPITATASPARIVSRPRPALQLRRTPCARPSAARPRKSGWSRRSSCWSVWVGPAARGHPSAEVTSPTGHPGDVALCTARPMRRSVACWDSDRVGNTWSWWLVALGLSGWLVAVVAAVARSRSKRASVKAFEERGWLLERERESAQPVPPSTAERARIAARAARHRQPQRQPDGVQAGAAREVLASDPAEAAAALLRRRGRRTRRDDRAAAPARGPARTVGGRRRRTDADLSPQPSLSRLSPLDRPDRLRRAAGRGSDLRRTAPAARRRSTSPRTGSSRRR